MKTLLRSPTTDFNAVRDGRNSLPLYIDIDLTTARSISANTQLVLDIAGNSFYSDADTVKGGNAVIHFQDTNLGISAAPFFVSPGFIANVGFTKLLIENTAQVGKRLRIFYGVDIDFQAGVNASIAIAGNVTVGNTIAQKIPVYETGMDYGVSFQSATTYPALTPETIISPAANVNGVIIHFAEMLSFNASVNCFGTMVAKSSAPANLIDGDVILLTTTFASQTACGKLAHPIKIAAGKGLYFIPLTIESVGYRHVKYTLL